MSFSDLVHASLRHRSLVLVLAALLLGLGAWSATRQPVDVLPELTRPSVSVHVEAPALSAADAATQLAQPIESSLSGLPGLLRLRSSSVAGLALVQADFGWGTDPYRNRQLVTERLEATRPQLPPGLQPRLGPLSSLMGEVLLIALRGGEDEASQRALRTHADWTLRPALLAVPGVAQVTVIGGQVAQWEVQPDPARLRLFDVRIDQIETALRGYGENRGGGIGATDGRERSLRGLAVPFDPLDLGRVALAQRPAGPVWLNQVATIAEGSRLRRGAAGADGDPAVTLAINKLPGADTLAVTRAAEARLHALDAQLPPGATRSLLFRQADYIRASMGNVRDALWHGALIVALVLALFLSGGRATLISLIALPLSVAGAILVLSLLGFSINTLTLGGLAIAVGELVDDAVVGVENVARRLRESGEITIQRIADATVEVRAGILLATLLIVAGFLPLFALAGVEGRLFGSLGAAYVAAILASLIVAATVTPVLCALGLDRRHLPQERAWLHTLKRLYASALTRTLARPRRLLAGCALLLALAAISAASLPRGFLPPLNESTLTVNLVLTPGLALEESDRIGRAAEKLLLEIPEVGSVGRRTGRAELDEHAEGVHYSELDLRLHADGRPRSEVIAEVQARLALLPGQASVSQPISHRIDHLLSGVRAPLAIKLFGEDAVALDAQAARLRKLIGEIPGLKDAGLEGEGQVFETRVQVDAARAALHGLSPPRVLDAIEGLASGRVLSRIVEGPRRFDLVLRLPESERAPQHLADLLIDAPSGAVPLGWIADIETVPVPDRVLREEARQRRVIAVFPAAQGDFGASVRELERRLEALPKTAGVEIRLEGQTAEARLAGTRIALLGLLSLLAMAWLLHARFQSWPTVLIVLGSVPLAWVGGALALRLTGTALSLASLVGFVTLAGIAARNSILKLGRYQDLMQHEGMAFGIELVLRGAGERLTPVLMTSLVAAVALLPLLLGSEAPGKELLHPVALVVFGGLLGSTLLDSFVTPALFLRFGRR